jgi:hypothetical protein
MIERLLVGIIETCFEILGYYTAKVMLPVLSLGRVHVAPGIWQPFATSGQPLFKRLRNGTIMVKHNIASFAGLSIWALAIALIFAVRSFLG